MKLPSGDEGKEVEGLEHRRCCPLSKRKKGFIMEGFEPAD